MLSVKEHAKNPPLKPPTAASGGLVAARQHGILTKVADIESTRRGAGDQGVQFLGGEYLLGIIRSSSGYITIIHSAIRLCYYITIKSLGYIVSYDVIPVVPHEAVAEVSE